MQHSQRESVTSTPTTQDTSLSLQFLNDICIFKQDNFSSIFSLVVGGCFLHIFIWQTATSKNEIKFMSQKIAVLFNKDENLHDLNT